MAVKFRKKFNIMRVVGKLSVTIIALWAGGVIVTALGDVMNKTCSPFYQGLTLIGWTTAAGPADATGCVGNVNTITSVNGSGILAVVGIIGLASIVLEFVEFRLG